MKLSSIFVLTFLTFPLTSLNAQTRLNNPIQTIASFSFDGHASDISGFGNHGDINGAITTEDRFLNVNKALLFNGINDWVGVDLSESLSHRGATTLSIWAKGASSSDNFTTLIGQGSLFQDELGIDPIGIGINDGNVLNVIVAGDELVLDKYVGIEINAENWNHYVLTYQPGEYVKVYLNGRMVRQFVDNIPYQLKTARNGYNFGVQSKRGIQGRSFFNGALDEALIVKRALSEEEINSIYYSNGWEIEDEDLTENLVAYYPFNGNAVDESVNDNDGEILGSTLTTDRFGNPNSAFIFDGTNDRIKINLSESLIITGDITLSVWVKPSAFDKTSSAILTMQGSTNDQGNSANALYKLNFPGDNTLRYAHEGSNGINVAVDFINTEFLQESWSHIVLIRDTEDKTLTLYKDGQFAEVRSFDNLPVGGENATLTIGENTGTTVLQDRFFFGKIDDIRIYNAALDQSDILALYHEQAVEINSLSEIQVSNESDADEGELKFRLYQNYPNPFNPSTTIQFDLEVQSKVKLNVYDITGRLIQTLVNSRLSAGSHDYIFDASNLSTGIYFYQLSTANSTQIKKFTLIK